jgi:hypothetical protein
MEKSEIPIWLWNALKLSAKVEHIFPDACRFQPSQYEDPKG